MHRGFVILAGLAFCVSPVAVFGQDFIDLEAERAQQAARVDAAGSNQTPGTATNQTPSVGAGQAPATNTLPAPAGGSNLAPGVPQTSNSGTTNTGNLGELFYQLQLLQEEVRQLRGQMEEQAHQLRQLKQQSLERYVDMDRRLSSADGAGDTSGAAADGVSGAVAPVLPGEEEAYRAAYGLLVGQKFDEAVTGFKQFLRDYPSGRFAPNAWYWLGELYLVITPRDLESSRQAFTLLLEQYPGNNKEADARFKLGKVYFDKGNPEVARQHFDRVIKEYDSDNSAVKLARDFVAENY
ncbi:MAG: tetratricopeptide repeat protein [Halieaceae bacterium]|nr:tetratricopeptide repeat protein [Halieaceae bacterium]